MDIQDSDLSLFCDDFWEFLLQIQERKKRGHNDYNPLLCVQKMHDEVRMHSGMIYSLLDVRGLHYQENLFLDLFLDEMNLKEWFGNSKNVYVKKEYKNIDIFISNGKKHIILENKIWAGDQQGQIARYIQKIEQEYEITQADDIVVIYLTLYGDAPSDFSLNNNGKKWEIQDDVLVCNKKRILYRQIAYGKEIMQWLENAKYEVCNIKNLDSALGFYIDVLQQLLQTKGNTMSVKGFF
ncbi:PD-(D/E)XK nuclease family protein [uncultured Helicobacter sp.]|uniref:PDDEXK-like family protein n=1 Tax=uncultured Helicobacter sp. TaxID=175537 RepID=UPI00262417E0|nr:PD-(D/E)XK nuclease family protein [uncultured Helicobacter sp.]